MKRKLVIGGTYAWYQARVLEIVVWIAVACHVVALVLLLGDPSSFAFDGQGRLLRQHGAWNIGVPDTVFDVSVHLADGADVNVRAAVLSLMTAIALWSLVALVFHEVADACRGVTQWLREENDAGLHTPLASHLRRIGWYLLIVFVVECVAELIAIFVDVSVSISLGPINVWVVFGVFALLLGSVFDYAVSMQREMDGLV